VTGRPVPADGGVRRYLRSNEGVDENLRDESYLLVRPDVPKPQKDE